MYLGDIGRHEGCCGLAPAARLVNQGSPLRGGPRNGTIGLRNVVIRSPMVSSQLADRAGVNTSEPGARSSLGAAIAVIAMSSPNTMPPTFRGRSSRQENSREDEFTSLNEEKKNEPTTARHVRDLAPTNPHRLLARRLPLARRVPRSSRAMTADHALDACRPLAHRGSVGRRRAWRVRPAPEHRGQGSRGTRTWHTWRARPVLPGNGPGHPECHRAVEFPITQHVAGDQDTAVRDPRGGMPRSVPIVHHEL